MTSLPGYDSWLESPYTNQHECDDDACDPDDCRCQEDAEDAYEAERLARAEADRDCGRDDG